MWTALTYVCTLLGIPTNIAWVVGGGVGLVGAVAVTQIIKNAETDPGFTREQSAEESRRNIEKARAREHLHDINLANQCKLYDTRRPTLPQKDATYWEPLVKLEGRFREFSRLGLCTGQPPTAKDLDLVYDRALILAALKKGFHNPELAPPSGIQELRRIFDEGTSVLHKIIKPFLPICGEHPDIPKLVGAWPQNEDETCRETALVGAGLLKGPILTTLERDVLFFANAIKDHWYSHPEDFSTRYVEHPDILKIREKAAKTLDQRPGPPQITEKRNEADTTKNPPQNNTLATAVRQSFVVPRYSEERS